MVDQKLTVPQSHFGITSILVATPRFAPTSNASTTSKIPSTQVSAAPTFWVHLPMPTPSMLVVNATQIAASAAASRAARLPVAGTQRVEAGAHIEHRGGGKPEGDAHPVHPETEEAVPGAEIAARPDIQAARAAWVFHGERAHGHRQWQGEKQ